MHSNCAAKIGGGSTPEVVDSFCYLGDILSVDGNADVAVTAGMQYGLNNFGWNKFRWM